MFSLIVSECKSLYHVSAKISKELSKHRVKQAREDSDYDDEFIVKSEETEKQIKTAEELLELVQEYIDKN